RDYRTIWLSDIHLGTRGCKAAFLHDFLKRNQCRTLYLVGDIIDGWQIKKKLYWTQAQSDVVRRLMKMAKKGTRIIYVPGNHDEALRDYLDIDLAGIKVVGEAVHETADGRRLLVIHGDAFDSILRYARWLAFLGDRSYQFLLSLNHMVNALRGWLGLPYWSLSAYLKFKVKNAVEFISRFEEAVAHAAAERGADGVVCGHIHHAEIKPIGDIMYYNDGDWVESCTALVEHHDGRMEILHWAEDAQAHAAIRDKAALADDGAA
ncbi:MAG: UDP-2,3-diacylglucosamine diphosphatase, partial [Alphaproteobacteria bacterium]